MEVSGEGEWILERGGGCAAPPSGKNLPSPCGDPSPEAACSCRGRGKGWGLEATRIVLHAP